MIVNLLVPGTGLAALGQFRLACLTQGCLIITVLAACWSRFVFKPLSIQLILGITALIYLISSGLCLVIKRPNPVKRYRQLISTFLFMVMSLSAFSAGYIYKHQWLGVHIYFVPSMSMHPTLKPGQFILLDTWVYHDRELQQNDIVVFQQDGGNQWLVKRVASWPNGELQHHEKWFVLGDNRNYSRDSRNFGGITKQQIIGQVKLVLLSIDQNHNLLQDGYLQPVN